MTNLIKELLSLNEGDDKDFIAAGKKALNTFHKALEDEKINAFDEMYGAIGHGMPDGGVEKMLYDPKTGDFYIDFVWVMSFEEEEEEDMSEHAFVKINKSGVLTEIDKMPKDEKFRDVTTMCPEFEG